MQLRSRFHNEKGQMQFRHEYENVRAHEGLFILTSQEVSFSKKKKKKWK